MRNICTVTTFVATVSLLTMSAALADPAAFTVITLHENAKALFAQQLEWWHGNHYSTKSILDCAQDSCNTWELPAVAMSNTSISVVAIVQHPQDPTCADWYTGELTPALQNLNANYFELRLKHTDTVCK